ncbi:putative leucine-rich repeat extensin-like protein 7 [Iris pallida]|uniref:Leucine-rich repeat extensin-like protein 7 n=1 Tax=Iris pallida TaxID=29817 RepID=A0AAX6GZW7_IRIPA|nr:putative leucine-rich repeat extensin-like protein 7 [Iris pallida]
MAGRHSTWKRERELHIGARRRKTPESASSVFSRASAKWRNSGITPGRRLTGVDARLVVFPCDYVPARDAEVGYDVSDVQAGWWQLGFLDGFISPPSIDIYI